MYWSILQVFDNLNEHDRVKIAGWFVGADAMSNWIKEIRKLADEAEARKDANAAKGHPNGACHEPSHIQAALELMTYFRDYEKQAEKNPQNRYTAPPRRRNRESPLMEVGESHRRATVPKSHMNQNYPVSLPVEIGGRVLMMMIVLDCLLQINK